MSSSYVDYLRGLVPPWMLTPEGSRWLNVFGRFKDTQQARLRQALKARFVAECPEDALPKHGRDRQIVRVPGETVEAYRARLLNAWDAWEQAGTRAGLIAQIKTLGYSNVELFENGTPAGGNWTGPPDGDTGSWWRFWIRIGQPNPWTDWKWGDGGLWGYDRTWGSTATARDVEAIRAIIRKWKPAHAECGGVVVELGTNLVQNGNDFTASGWTLVGLWNVSRDSLADYSGSNVHGVWRALSDTPDGPVIASIEAKAGTRSQVCLADSPACTTRAIVDLATGTVVSSNLGTVTVQAMSDGWWRILVASPSWATSNIAVALAEGGTITYEGDVSDIHVRGVSLWHASPRQDATVAQDVSSTSWVPTGIASRTATSMTDDTSYGEHKIDFTVTSMPSGRVYMAVEASSSGGRNLFMRVGGPTAIFNLSTGAVTYSSGTGLTASTVALESGWRRCIISGTPSNSVLTVGSSLPANSVFTGTGTTMLIRSVNVYKNPRQTITWPVDIWPAPGS